jgi:hypothetical protein
LLSFLHARTHRASLQISPSIVSHTVRRCFDQTAQATRSTLAILGGAARQSRKNAKLLTISRPKSRHQQPVEGKHTEPNNRLASDGTYGLYDDEGNLIEKRDATTNAG